MTSGEALRRVALLHCFTDEELQSLTKLGKVSDFEPYSNIIIEGELTWGIYFLMDGLVEVVRSNNLDGVNYQVAQLVPGAFFGELSLIDSNPRSATVRAMTPVKAMCIEKSEFESFLNQSTERKIRFMQHALTLIASRLREVDENFIVAQHQLWSRALQKESKRAA